MDGLVSKEPMIGFGPNPLNPHRDRPIDLACEKSPKRLRDLVRQTCPRVPGVYGMLDRKGELIYVGKSKSLRSRLLSYFAQSNSKEKSGRIIRAARAIQWETQPSEFAALVREQQLIRRFSPRWNVQEVPKRQRPVYLCLGRKPATFFLSATFPKDCLAIEGPFFGVGRMNTAVDSLNKVFKLRDCSQKQVFQFAEQMQLFDMEYRPGCLRLEVGNCLGPCAAGCTREVYALAVNEAHSYLEGFNSEPLTVIREAFDGAMQNRQYELAGRHHATISSLEYLDRKLKMLNRARRMYSFVYCVPGFDGCGIWYCIHGGEIVDVMAAPRDQRGQQATRKTIRAWQRLTDAKAQRGHGPYPYTLSLVASWFRKHKGEVESSTFAASDLLKQKVA